MILFLVLCTAAVTTAAVQPPICPTDVAIKEGGRFALHCSTVGSHTAPFHYIRWWSDSKENVIFDGELLYKRHVNNRYSATNHANGLSDFKVINVSMDDAHQFGCHDSMTGKESSAYVTVIDSMSPSLLVSESRVGCVVKYAGHLEPRVEWIDHEGKVMDADRQVVHGPGVSVEVQVGVARADMPSICRVNFVVRNNCTQQTSVNSWTIEHYQHAPAVKHCVPPFYRLYSCVVSVVAVLLLIWAWTATVKVRQRSSNDSTDSEQCMRDVTGLRVPPTGHAPDYHPLVSSDEYNELPGYDQLEAKNVMFTS